MRTGNDPRSVARGCVLVTGVAGFIGSHLAERLVAEGYEVIGVDCFTDYYPRWMKERNIKNLLGHERFTFLEADLQDLDLVALLRGDWPAERWPLTDGDRGQVSLVRGRPVDYVCHLAAQAGVRASWGCSFEVYTRNNVLATQRLLEAAKEVPLKKFVYASSSSVYGDAEAYPTSEDITPRPVSPYGVTKLAGEHLCILYHKNFGIPTIALRYFTVYGPRQRPDMAFHKFIRAMLSGEEITVYGDGKQTRDFTYVDDAVQGTLLAMQSEVESGVFNIGGGSRVSVNEVLQMLEEIVGKKARVRYVASQKGDVQHTSADVGNAHLYLGYTPETTLECGLAKQIAWMHSML